MYNGTRSMVVGEEEEAAEVEVEKVERKPIVINSSFELDASHLLSTILFRGTPGCNARRPPSPSAEAAIRSRKGGARDKRERSPMR